jgi:molybdopterin/thiamine biosynthesis adenylyltransferase/rhodanese-related sulfurtransferase
MTDKELKRYNRHIMLPEIGIDGQQKLKRASVLVIGAGGLGCPVLQYLTAAGVGTIGIADDDTVDESNLQRQILYTTNDIGKFKTTVAIGKLSTQNPHCIFQSYQLRLTAGNALGIIRDYDIVVDGSDNFATRYLVNDACVMLNKPLVFGSVFKFEGQVAVFNYKGSATYRCLYPLPAVPEDAPNCSDIGVLGVLPGLAGLMQANEVIKIITGIGEVMSNKLLRFNALSMNFETFSFQLNPANREIKSFTGYEQFCGAQIKEISAAQLKEKIRLGQNIQIIDVREPAEYAVKNIGATLIPLSEIGKNLDKIERAIPVIIHCQSGMRSRKAVEILRDEGFDNVYSLKGGLSNL